MTYSTSRNVFIDQRSNLYSYDWYSSIGFTNFNSSVQGSIHTIVASATKGENPKWRDDIRNGRCATTLLQGSDCHVLKHVPGYAEATRSPRVNGGSYYQRRDNLFVSDFNIYPSSATGVSATSADNLAKTEFLRKLIDRQTSFHSGVFFGELKQTLSMLRRPAKALRRGIDQYFNAAKKRTKRLKEIKANQVAGETWLEYSYGWGPLIGDIEDGYKAINKLLEGPRFSPVKGEGNVDNQTTNSQTSVGGGAFVFRRTIIESSRATVVYFGYVDCKSNPGSFATNLFGFRWEEFVPTIWECIPYSFLVDYFTNIGEYLNGVSYQRTGLAWCQKTVRKRTVRRVVQHPTAISGWRLGNASPMESEVERTSVDRSIYEGNFVPDLEFSVPGYSDWKKWLNISALANARRLR